MFYFVHSGTTGKAPSTGLQAYDLIHWTDWKGENLIESSQPYDERFAHKSSVVKYNGVVYHFYCAVNKKDERGLL